MDTPFPGERVRVSWAAGENHFYPKPTCCGKNSVTANSCFLLFIEMAVMSGNAWYSDNTIESCIFTIYWKLYIISFDSMFYWLCVHQGYHFVPYNVNSWLILLQGFIFSSSQKCFCLCNHICGY